MSHIAEKTFQVLVLIIQQSQVQQGVGLKQKAKSVFAGRNIQGKQSRISSYS